MTPEFFSFFAPGLLAPLTKSYQRATTGLRPPPAGLLPGRMQLFYPGVGAHAPLPPPKTKLRLGSPMAESSRTRAALAGSALEGTLHPDPASPSRLEARLADAGARRPLTGGASPYGAFAGGGQRPGQGAGRRSGGGGRPLPSQYGTAPLQRPSRRGQPQARFPSQFPVHQQVHQPTRGRQPTRSHSQHAFAERGAPGRSPLTGRAPGSHPRHPPMQQQPVDRGGGAHAAAGPSVALDTDEYAAAFTELDQLRGLAAADPNDERRFDAANRPRTAPGAPADVPREYLEATAAASPAQRPGTSAGRVETAEPLGSNCRPRCRRTAPHWPPWTARGLGARLCTPERRLGRSEARGGLRSAPPPAPKPSVLRRAPPLCRRKSSG